MRNHKVQVKIVDEIPEDIDRLFTLIKQKREEEEEIEGEEDGS